MKRKRREYHCIDVEGTCSRCSAEFWTLKEAKAHHAATGHPTSFRRMMETLIGDYEELTKPQGKENGTPPT